MRCENQRETVKVRERGGVAVGRGRAREKVRERGGVAASGGEICVRRRAMVVREIRMRFLARNERIKKARSIERAVETN